jgi:cytoskeletal protein RodZ
MVRLLGGMMLTTFFAALLCSLLLVATIHGQEVIVAREKKPEPLSQTPEPSSKEAAPNLQELPSETPAPTPRKTKRREKKPAPGRLTLEEMRAAGERAAEGINKESVSEGTKAREPDAETAPAPLPTTAATARPVKRQTPVERASSSRPAKSRTMNLEGIGPIRPTMMESGREPPSPSPSR